MNFTIELNYDFGLLAVCDESGYYWKWQGMGEYKGHCSSAPIESAALAMEDAVRTLYGVTKSRSN